MNTDILAILHHLKDKEAIKHFFSLLQKMIQTLGIQADDKRMAAHPRNSDQKFSITLRKDKVLLIEKKNGEIIFQFKVKERNDFEKIFSLKDLDKPGLRISYQELLAKSEHTEILYAAWLKACEDDLPTKNAAQWEDHAPEMYEIATNPDLLEKYIEASQQTITMTKKRLQEITEQIQERLKAENHPLGAHTWISQNGYSHTSISPKATAYTELHYEILYDTKSENPLNVEFHSENKKYSKLFAGFLAMLVDDKLMIDKWSEYGGKDNKRLLFKEGIKVDDEKIIDKLTEMAKTMYDKVQAPLIQFLKDNNLFEKYMPSNSTENRAEKKEILSFPLNQILYGPPGTGKTYHTINEALAIIENKTLEELEKEEKAENGRKNLTDRFKTYLDKGQIMFCTFHQSMSYEDFVEGIKPLKPKEGDTFVKYDIENGIFKRICEKADSSFMDNFDAIYQKFVTDLGENRLKLITPIRNNVFEISLNSKESLKLYTGAELLEKGSITKEKLKIYLTDTKRIGDWGAYFQGVVNYLKKYYNKYVLIIDEINRGNVSQIFGELITLIEDSKRKGNAEALDIELPYSKIPFSVPNNVYVIGTMNTADRSVEALDTALRRRFVFKEMEPQSSLLALDCEGINLQALLAKINERLEALLSKDHRMGHAYFIDCKTEKDLQMVFYQKIIPLLQEYFYGDLGKIQLIIGEDFVTKEPVKAGIFMGEKTYNGRLPIRIHFLKPENFLLAIQKIYA